MKEQPSSKKTGCENPKKRILIRIFFDNEKDPIIEKLSEKRFSELVPTAEELSIIKCLFSKFV